MTAESIKACCADLYASDWVRLLLGDALHPGGSALTERLGILLGLDARSRVLDLAAGRGTSALHLARVFGCHIRTPTDCDGGRCTNLGAHADGGAALRSTLFDTWLEDELFQGAPPALRD